MGGINDRGIHDRGIFLLSSSCPRHLSQRGEKEKREIIKKKKSRGYMKTFEKHVDGMYWIYYHSINSHKGLTSFVFNHQQWNSSQCTANTEPAFCLRQLERRGKERGKAHEKHEWVGFADSSNYRAWQSAYKHISHAVNSRAGALLYDMWAFWSLSNLDKWEEIAMNITLKSWSVV